MSNCLNLHRRYSNQSVTDCNQLVTNYHGLFNSNHFADVGKMVNPIKNKEIYRFANISKTFRAIIFNYGESAIIKTEQKDNKNG